MILCVWKLDFQVSVLSFKTYLRQTVDFVLTNICNVYNFVYVIRFLNAFRIFI